MFTRTSRLFRYDAIVRVWTFEFVGATCAITAKEGLARFARDHFEIEADGRIAAHTACLVSDTSMMVVHGRRVINTAALAAAAPAATTPHELIAHAIQAQIDLHPFTVHHHHIAIGQISIKLKRFFHTANVSFITCCTLSE
jgi:hypothetical protein